LDLVQVAGSKARHGNVIISVYPGRTTSNHNDLSCTPLSKHIHKDEDIIMLIILLLAFAVDRIKALAPQHPEWKIKRPSKAVLDNDLEALGPRARKGWLNWSMYTAWCDEYFNPEVALSPERFKMMEEDDFNHTEVHCTPANKKQCESGRLIDLDHIKDLDTHWMEVSLAFLDKLKGSDKPFFLYHATRGCHFDNYPPDEWAGKSRTRASATAWWKWIISWGNSSRSSTRPAN
jgi:hypothetical protein